VIDSLDELSARDTAEGAPEALLHGTVAIGDTIDRRFC
jgi:hypothetical protein